MFLENVIESEEAMNQKGCIKSIVVDSVCSEIKENISVDNSQESINSYIPTKNDDDETEEPPSKIIKLEEKSEFLEEINDEFVDEVKKY